MARAKTPETFRCHIKVKGEQCPVEMTMVNTSSFDLRTLRWKHPNGVRLSDLPHHAICPWHAEYLRSMGKKVQPMAQTVAICEDVERVARRTQRRNEEFQRRDRVIDSAILARQPALAVALLSAGIR